jgi:hypothetical protein
MNTERIRIEQHGFAGAVWIWAWLFAIGFLHLTFWKAVLGVVLWPYYIGTALSPLLRIQP